MEELSDIRVSDTNELRQRVYRSLCEQNELEFGAFGISESMLLRGGRECGIHYCVSGPRNVRLTAIWETDTNSVLFYDSAGRRTLRWKLVEAPDLGSPQPSPTGKLGYVESD